MIEYSTGDLLESDCDALVNTVNTNGVMGKGIALQFKERFPLNFKKYALACKNGEVKIGKMFVTRENDIFRNLYIVNFPTKVNWWQKSDKHFINKGLHDLRKVINDLEIKSIAIPPLGCGNGGLEWDLVKIMIESELGMLPIKIVVYEPLK